MKKYWLCSISVLLLVSASCAGDVEKIKIEWTVLCDISSGLENDKPYVMLGFKNSKGEGIDIHLTPNETKKIKKQKDMSLLSFVKHGYFEVYIYPDAFTDLIEGTKEEDRFKKHGAMEIYIYYKWPIAEDEHSITLLPNEKVLAYNHTIFRDNRGYTFFSLNNRINTNTEEVYEIDVDEAATPEKVLAIMKENNIDECYYSYPTFLPFGSLLDYNGFYIYSKLSDEVVLLF